MNHPNTIMKHFENRSFQFLLAIAIESVTALTNCIFLLSAYIGSIFFYTLFYWLYSLTTMHVFSSHVRLLYVNKRFNQSVNQSINQWTGDGLPCIQLS
jgi:hypothetical protein